MVGQHIFVRCRNEQNNAGTWTAAITENIVDKDIVRNLIEPRCNLDEAFAQRALVSCAENNVLRMYHIGDGITVVSRTYWVTDRITETMGRKGAYSVSYILTEKDTVRFSGDFGGAFDPACFESYDALVARIGQGRITVNETLDLFAHRDGGYDASVFAAAGLTAERFVQLMSGLYAAMENKQQLAVLLPADVRRAWETQGDPTAERLAYHILCLLPDFTRMQLGIASHWSCQVKDKMVSDMQLVFVHPEREEDIAYLKREGVMLLDLDTGKHTSGIPTADTAYFTFLWDSLADKSKIEAFWTEAKTKYRKLLRGKPCSARAMESIYLMERAAAGNFADASCVRRAFLLAADSFAGAGARVPAAEAFLQQAMQVLKLTECPPSAETEAALRALVQQDGEPTAHQAQEYAALLHFCEIGAADAESVEALCGEVDKAGRNAAGYYLTYLTAHADLATDKLTVQLAQFVSGLFVRLLKQTAEEELFRVVVQVLRQWSEKALAERQDTALDACFAKAYAAYLGERGGDASIRQTAYAYLFAYEQKAEPQQREELEKVLFREEKRLYKAEAGAHGGMPGLRMYAKSFFKALPEITKIKKETAIDCYQRLFRLSYMGDSEIVDVALAVYRAAIRTADGSDLAARIIPVLLGCQETALAQIEGETVVWQPEQVSTVLLIFELVNVADLAAYAPTEERVGNLMKWFGKEDVNTYTVLAFYLQKMSPGARQTVYGGMRSHGLLQNMFLHVLLGGKDGGLCAEIENYLNQSHMAKVTLVLKSAWPEQAGYAAETAQSCFGKWYAASLQQELQKAADARAAVVRIAQEYRALREIPARASGLRAVAKAKLDACAAPVLASVDRDGAAQLPPDVIRELVQSFEETAGGALPPNAQTFRLLAQFDARIEAGVLADIDAACAAACGSEDNVLIRRRLQYYIAHMENEDSKRICRLYDCLLQTANTPGADSFPVVEYLTSIGLGPRAETQSGVFLVNLLNQLSGKSAFEGVIGTAAMRYLRERVEQNPQAFSGDAFLAGCERLQSKDYFRHSGIRPLLSRIWMDRKLRFDASMFMLCALGAVAVCCAAAVMAWLLVTLGRVSTPVMLSVGIFVLLIVAAVDFWQWPRRSASHQTGRNRRNY